MNEKNQMISFRQMFAHAKVVIAYVLSKWLLIAGISIACALLGILYAYTMKPKYTGELSFVLADGNSQSGFSSLASQFGIDLGGGGNDVFSQDNVLVLMTSRRILSRALFRSLPNSKETLINLYIRSEKLNIAWQKDAHLKPAYPFPASANNMTPLQDSLFREMYTTLKTGNFTVQQPDKKVNVFSVSTTHTNELFACYLTKYLVEESSSFYIETKTSIARQNLNMLTHEADSLRARLGHNIINAATAVDRTFNLNPAYQVERVPIQQNQADAAVTQAAYTEVVKNLEIAKITLAKAYPIYQIIDEPALPLKQEKMGRLLAAVIFGAIAGLLSIAYFIIRYFLLHELAAGNNFEYRNATADSLA